ncbi:MAG: hypothetical protein LBV69_01370 [Bacteroidales bacterium]|jgi:DNA modification methylase|nr:hypothetical protein [Bacteroidales bacterium]
MTLGKYEINNIYNVDCLLGMKELPENCIDCKKTADFIEELLTENKND